MGMMFASSNSSKTSSKLFGFMLSENSINKYLELFMVDICLCNYYRGCFSLCVIALIYYLDRQTHRV